MRLPHQAFRERAVDVIGKAPTSMRICARCALRYANRNAKRPEKIMTPAKRWRVGIVAAFLFICWLFYRFVKTQLG
jgi:hypothetical protein